MSVFDEEVIKSKHCKKIIDTRNILKLFINNTAVSKNEIMKELFYTSDGRTEASNVKVFERAKNSIKEEYDINIIFNRSLKKYTINSDDFDKVVSIVNSMENFVISSHFLDSFKLQSVQSDIIQYDHADSLKGKDKFGVLLKAILDKRTIKFTHTNLKGNTKAVEFQPYLLKEHAYRWYVFGKTLKNNKWLKQAYSLERIESEIETGVKFKLDKSIKLKDVFSDTIGVWVIENGKEIEKYNVVFEVENDISSLVENLPVHMSQKIIYKDTDKTTFEIYVRGNYELFNMLFQYLPGIRVISPPEIKDRFYSLLEDTINRK